LAGAPPFDGEDLAPILYQIVHEVPAPVSERNHAVPRSLDAVIERALAKDPEVRYPSARAFGEALAQAMAAGTVGTAERGVAPASRSPRRRALAAVACLAATAFGGWAAWARWAPERPVVASRSSSRTEQHASPAAVTPSAASHPSDPAATSGPPSRSSARFPSPSDVPADTVAVTPIDPDWPASAAIVPAPPAEVPPTSSAASIEPPPEPVRAPPPASGHGSAARQAPALGTIRVSTNPSVDVFLDGEFQGRTESQPLVVSGVAPGRRTLTLRLGSREQMLLTTVNGGQTAAVTHRFPPEPAPGSVEKLRDALETGQREALDKLREGVDKAQREVVGGLRDLLEKIDGDRGNRGPDSERKPDRR
jgi:hypothetical protein